MGVFILALLLSPVSWKAHYVSLIMPHMLLIWYYLTKVPEDRFLKWLLAASFTLNTVTVEGIVGGRLADIFESYSCIVFGTLVLLFALVRFRIQYRKDEA